MNTIKPIFKGNVMMNHNPVGIALNIQEDLESLQYREQDLLGKTVLVLGSSTGYGLSARMVLAMRGANTIGVAFERPVSAGMRNIEGFEKQIKGYVPTTIHKTFIGDCFSNDMKDTVYEFLIGNNLQLSEVVYSVASGRRIREDLPLIDNKAQFTFSHLGAVGQEVTGLTLDLETETMYEMTLPPLSEQQVADTVTVMGGEDWEIWLGEMSFLSLLTKDCTTYALSYVGTDLNAALYRDGSLGAAKDDLLRAKDVIENVWGVKSEVVVCRAVVTRASAFIPNFAPAIMALEQVHRELGMLETTLDQMKKMFICEDYDDLGRMRLDGYETMVEVQDEMKVLLEKLTPENFKEVVAYDLFKSEILKQNGFR